VRFQRSILAAALAAGLVIATPALASAAPKPTPEQPKVIATGLAAPFNLAFWGNQLYVADGMQNLVGKVGVRDGSITPIATDQIGASGVATSFDGRTVAYTTTVTNFETFENTASGLTIQGPRGDKIYADTLAFDRANNPDAVNHYGVENPDQCVIDALSAIGFPHDYTGGVDSHAYSVASYGSSWIVADAGSNTVLSVDRKGGIRTLAVLPPQPVEITADMAAAFGLPACVAGVTYSFEPVPTDVEVGLDGMLYVTTLPGGPEGPVLGARGSVYKVNPWNGSSQLVVTGFVGATNLALGWRGEIYVAELFNEGGRISLVKDGAISLFAALPGAVAVETAIDGSVWATTMGSEEPAAPGTIVQLTTGALFRG
jgi:hypothetical protein